MTATPSSSGAVAGASHGEDARVAPSSRLSLGLLLSYGAGQVGGQMFRDAPAALLPLFMTTILGVPAWMGGVAILLPKLWVIVCDPLVGAWSDRLKARHGRTPFLLAGALLTGLGFAALFALSGFASPVAAAATVGFLYLLASTGFSIFSVPYLAVASELSGDTNERTRLMAWRVIASTVGVLLAVGAAQPLVYAFGGGASGWRTMGVLFGAISLATMLTTAITLRRVRLIAEAPPASGSLLASIAQALRYRPFALLILTYMLQSIAQATGYSVIGFVFLYGIGSVGIILPFILVMTAGSLLAQPMWLACALRLGKPATLLIAMTCWIALTLTWFLLRPDAHAVVTLPLAGPLSLQELFVLVRAFPLAMFNAGFILLTLSMLTDTVEAARDAHGSAEEGVFSGIFSATEKLSFALGPLLAGVVMSASGFRSSTTGMIPQSAGAVTGILLCYSIIPATIAALSLVTFAFYRQAQARAEAAVRASHNPAAAPLA